MISKFKFVNIFGIILSIYSCAFASDTETQKVTIIADNLTYNASGTELKASGNVRVEYGHYKLSTPQLTYNKKTKILTANQPIELHDKDTFKIIASSAEINDNFKQIIATKVTALIEKKFYIQSKQMERNKNNQLAFYSSIGTACSVCPNSPVPMWRIKSEKILHDQHARQLHFKNARMELLGLPVFYTPYIRIPEPGIKRATGLLTPKILTSDLLGVGIKQPYYINLNKSSDITISILKTTKTNFLLETDYRRLFSNGSLFFSSAAKPASNNNILDGYFQIFGENHLNQNYKLTYDATAVSDSGFLGKYGYRDTDRLTSSIGLTNQKQRKFSKAALVYFTSLRDNEQEEFVIVPSFFTRNFKNNKKLNIFSDVEISLVGLTKKDLSTDVRLNASFGAEKVLQIEPGLRVKGSAKVSNSLYRVNLEKSKTNIYKYFDPTLGLELSFPLYKASLDRLDTIKPKLQLVYTPEISFNDAIPNADSQQVKLDQSSLFSLNRFSGLDKQEFGLRLNSGIEYSVENNGPFSYDLALGQIFRRAPSDQFSEGSGLSGMKSDILISGNLNYNSLLTVHGEQLYDETLKLKHAETTLSFIQPSRTISSGLIFFEADLSENRPSDLTELTLGIEANISENWLTNFDLRRNLNENENINGAVRFSFENECAKINLSFRKRFTETNSLPEDFSIELTFDLNGMGQKPNLVRKSNCLIYN